MKLKIEEILDKIEELSNGQTIDFISSLDVTLEQMELLADHDDNYVRYGLAENPKITEKIMIKLASDKEDFVKYVLAKNPKITEEIMLQLANNKDSIIGSLARNPNLTEKIMILLVNNENEGVRIALARNPKITDKIMIQLSSDNSSFVSSEVFRKLKKLNSLKKEELEEAYDLIMNSKHIGRKYFKKTFDYIINEFPEVSKLAKMFKKLVLKLKKDLK